MGLHPWMNSAWVKVPNPVFDECDSCKEQFFDEEANIKIDTYVSRSAKKQHIPSK
jgi:hypothetical protein